MKRLGKMLKINKIIRHDVATPFPLPDECIDVCITSPPYWGLRDYGEDVYTIWNEHPNCKHEWGQTLPKGGRTKRKEDGDPKHKKEGIAEGFALASGGNFCQLCGAWKGQLGLEPQPLMYIDHLVQVAREISRVLKKGGSFYLNLGDTYFGKPKSSVKGGLQNKNYGNKKSKHGYDNRGDSYKALVNKSNWLKSKQLMLIPSRVAIALQEDGWILRNDIIWHKPNPMPSSVKDRLNTTYEHLFHFAKARKYYYDLDAIRTPYKPLNRWGGNLVKIPKETKTDLDNQPYAVQYRERLLQPNIKGKNPGDVRTIPTRSFKGAHFAVFPEELLMKPLKSSCPTQICKKCGKARERIIKVNNPSKEYADNDGLVDANKIQKTSNPQSIQSLHRNTSPDGKTKGVYYSGETIGWSDCGCNAGFDSGVVLDPFAGRGTVGKVARKLGMYFILFDIKPEYCEMANLYIYGQQRKVHKNDSKLTDFIP